MVGDAVPLRAHSLSSLFTDFAALHGSPQFQEFLTELYRILGERLQVTKAIVFLKHFIRTITLLAAKHGYPAVGPPFEGLGAGYAASAVVCILAVLLVSRSPIAITAAAVALSLWALSARAYTCFVRVQLVCVVVVHRLPGIVCSAFELGPSSALRRCCGVPMLIMSQNLCSDC